MSNKITFRVLLALAALLIGAAAGTERDAAAALPPGNTVEQWNKIAEDTVVGSGAFQNEGSSTWRTSRARSTTRSSRSRVAISRSSRRSGSGRKPRPTPRSSRLPTGRSGTTSRPRIPASMRRTRRRWRRFPNGPAKVSGEKIGQVAANQVIRARSVDGLMTPIAITSSFPTLTPGPGVWRLTPPFAPAQTPWVGERAPVHPAKRRPVPARPAAVALEPRVGRGVQRGRGVRRREQHASVRVAQTNVAQFWTANVIRQYNGVVRDITDARHLNLAQTARLAAMVNVVAADAGIAVMNAKYHYLFWRPVTAIDPAAVAPTASARCRATTTATRRPSSKPGWRPLLATPNHPEYPAAHGSLTGAMADVFSAFLGSNQINLDIHGFDPNGPAGNLNAVRALQHRRRPPDRDRQRSRLGRRSTTASPSSPASTSAQRWPTTTSHTPSNRSARSRLNSLGARQRNASRGWLRRSNRASPIYSSIRPSNLPAAAGLVSS